MAPKVITQAEQSTGAHADGPPKFESFSHLSVPCRDLEEAKRFYIDVLGGELLIDVPPTFAEVKVADAAIGLGAEGCCFLTRSAEYPHFAFFAGPSEMVRMKEWLTRCGIPTSNFWTRYGIETLMFFRDPSGNLIELFCKGPFPGAEDLPHGGPRGHGVAVDIDALHYDEWRLPG